MSTERPYSPSERDRKLVSSSLKSFPKSFKDRVLEIWPRVGEPDVLASRWLRFLEDSDFLEEDPSIADVSLAITVLGNSSFLSRFITRHARAIQSVTKGSLKHSSFKIEEGDFYLEKYTYLLWLFHKRLLSEFSIQEEWKHLTEMADEITRCSLRHLSEKFGYSQELQVLALGKLGARELNLSSDIDILYFTGKLQNEGESLPALTRLAKNHVEFLSRIDKEGFLYRVDLRLRPSGQQGPLVQSIPSITRYYEGYGKTWERAVLLRARPLEPDTNSSRRLIENLKPFVYRRFIDHGMIDDLRDMKARIEQSAMRLKADDRNIKTGQGGIRSIEFIVQAFQLIYGGQLPEIRNLGTIETLEALGERKLFDLESLDLLRKAYPFLRNVEHGLQWMDEAQTHELPKQNQKEKWLHLRALCPDDMELESKTKRVRESVQTIFDEVFLPERRKSNHLYWDRPWDSEPSKDDIPKELRSDVAGSESDVANWLHVISQRVRRMNLSPRATRHFRRLVPQLIQQLHYLPEPEEALSILLNFIESNRARSGFFLTLAENPRTLRHLLRLFSTSSWLADTFIKHPELLDSLLLSTHSQSDDLGLSFTQELREVLDSDEDRSWKLNRLRQFKREQFLRVALKDLAGEREWQETALRLTEVSEQLVRSTFEITKSEKPGWKKLKILPVAMGSLGAGEMSYASDVDLVFLIDDSNNGDNDISEAVRLTQRVISGLTLHSEAGTLFKVDMRLRPSGNQGPLVSTFSHFERYHESKAQLWERQSLLRARPIAGSKRLKTRFLQLRDRFCFSSPRVEVSDLHFMRERLEKELSGESGHSKNVKLGRGGLTDIDFIVSYFQMTKGLDNERLRTHSPMIALEEIGRSNLLSKAKSRELLEGYCFLRQMENRLRLMLDRPISAISLEENYLKKLHRGFNLGAEKKVKNAEELKELYVRNTERIREVFQSVIGQA